MNTFKVGEIEQKKFNSFLLGWQVYEELVTNAQATGSFQLDAPLGSDLRIVAHCQDEADLDSIQVMSPSGKIYDLPLVSDGMLHIRIPQTDEVNYWRFYIIEQFNCFVLFLVIPFGFNWVINR